jgi:aminoglycoside phosphotransferase (APT) family kinase protein
MDTSSGVAAVPAGTSPPGRRSDAGAVRLTGRDVAGLLLAGDMYRTPYEELVARHGAGSARDLSSVDWYHAFACYRLGVLLEGTHARSTAGQADRGSGQRMRQMAAALFEQGLAIAAGRS